MLNVKTTLGSSPIAGTGLFAAEFIPKGTVIWQFDPMIDQVYTEEQFRAVSPAHKSFLKTYCFMYMGKYYLCVDNARFFNHSDEPNCMSSDFNETSLGCTIAKRDIEIGEELTDDYSLFGFTESDKAFNLDIYSSQEI
jgi:SET domain-containing protein